MAVRPLSKMKRADVIEELSRVYGIDEPPDHNVQMLKSILCEQRTMQKAGTIFKLPRMPTRKADILEALKDEGYDMDKLTGSETNGLLQRNLLFLRQHNKAVTAENIHDQQQPSRETKNIHAWERFVIGIHTDNMCKASLIDMMNEDKRPSPFEGIPEGWEDVCNQGLIPANTR